MSPHTFRLRPAPHSRTPIKSYSLKVYPENHFINWQQDPFGNYLARVVFPEKTKKFWFTVDLVAELTVARSGITQSFTTRNLLYRPERIELQLVDGPFKKLAGSWDFRSLGQDGCRVEMQLSL